MFAKYDTATSLYKLALAVSNKFGRVIMGDNYYDFTYDFNDASWHFIHLALVKQTSASNTRMVLWVDDNTAQVKTFTGVYTDANTYDVYMG